MDQDRIVNLEKQVAGLQATVDTLGMIQQVQKLEAEKGELCLRIKTVQLESELLRHCISDPVLPYKVQLLERRLPKLFEMMIPDQDNPEGVLQSWLDGLKAEGAAQERERIIGILLRTGAPRVFTDYIDDDLIGEDCWDEVKLRAALAPQAQEGGEKC